ncbi:MAG: hypothetical protein HRU03_05620 [Nanoarchaeales archaeon]|nr:hypothetical protein [Nanoarchaeales archaeon]
MKPTVYFVNLIGDLDVNFLVDFQEKIVSEYTLKQNKNIIYGFNLSPTISFGGNKKINSFRDNFNLFDVETLNLNYIKSSRPGGTTYLGPGQRTYFFNIGIGSSKKIPNPIFEFGHKLLDTIVDLSKNLPCENSLIDKEKILTESQTDLFYQHGDKKFKLGSLGIKGSCEKQNLVSKIVTRFGVNFYLTKKGLEHFNLINPCGIQDKNISVGCLEDLLQTQLEVDLFDESFIKSFEKIFPFEVLRDENLSCDLQKIYDEISRNKK